MKIYISGAISKDPEYREKFEEAEKFLRALGHIVFNPAKNPDGLTYREYIDIGLAQLSKCDAVFVLRGFRGYHSQRIELIYADKVKVPIYYDDAVTRYEMMREAKLMIRQSVPWEAD